MSVMCTKNMQKKAQVDNLYLGSILMKGFPNIFRPALFLEDVSLCMC